MLILMSIQTSYHPLTGQLWSEVKHVRRFLVEYILSGIDVQKLALEKGVRKGGEIDAIRNKVIQDLEHELITLVPERAYTRAIELAELYTYVTLTEMSFLPKCSVRGIPFETEQSLRLARTFDINTNPSKNQNYSTLKVASIDPLTGLSELDRKVLLEAADYLNSDQLVILKESLAETTAKIQNARRADEYVKKHMQNSTEDPSRKFHE
jgi:hypothetical protein